MTIVQAIIFGVLALTWYNYIYIYFYNIFGIDPRLVPFMEACKTSYGEGFCRKLIYVLVYAAELPIVVPLYMVYSIIFFIAIRIIGQPSAKTIIYALSYMSVFLFGLLYYGTGAAGWHWPATLIQQFLAMCLAVWLARHLISLGTRTLRSLLQS